MDGPPNVPFMALCSEHPYASPSASRRGAVVTAFLLVLALAGCGGEPARPPAPASSAPVPAPSSATPSASIAATPTRDYLQDEMRKAFRTAMKAHPGANLDRCTRTTPLGDKKCGKALAAAEQVAETTGIVLRASDPKNADLLYGGAFGLINQFLGTYGQLRDPVPCYGLSKKPQPPAQLRAEAEAICTEAAAITKVSWDILVGQFQ